MENKTAAFLFEIPPDRSLRSGGGKVRVPFVDKGIHHIAKVIRTAYVQWETASQGGFFQDLDPRVKVLVTAFYLVIVSIKKELAPELYLTGLVFVLAAASRLEIAPFYRRIFFISFFFGFLIALPSSLNLIRPGHVLLPLFSLARPYDLWIYHIPREIGLTKEGLQGVAMLTSRVFNSISLSLLVLYTTPFTEILRALKVLKVPDTFLMVISLAYKYIFLFAKTVEDMHLAKKSRMVGAACDEEARRWVAGRIGLIFRKTQIKCDELHKAMLSRGFAGEVRLHDFNAPSRSDYTAGLSLLTAGIFLLWI